MTIKFAGGPLPLAGPFGQPFPANIGGKQYTHCEVWVGLATRRLMDKRRGPFYPVLILRDEDVLWGHDPSHISPAWIGAAHPYFNEAAQFSLSLHKLNQ